jgi:pyruvate formate lyase activating enzyme
MKKASQNSPLNPDESYHPAQFYTLEDNNVRCLLCPHYCLIPQGKTGQCKTRLNIDQALWSTSYGKAVAAHIDPVEKKPLFHFQPGSNTFSIGTAGCNLKCLNCQNWEISTRNPLQLNHVHLPPQKVVEMAIQHQCPSISFTYSEPIVFYEYMLDTAILAHEAGLKTIMVSAGYINPIPLKKLLPHIDAANIDLKTFNPTTYKKLNGAELNDVLNTLISFKENGTWLEITNLLVTDYTDDMKTIGKMCKWLVNNDFITTPLHFSRFTPMHKLTNTEPTNIKTVEEALSIAHSEGLKFVYAGNMPYHKNQNTICNHCGYTLIYRQVHTPVKNLLIKGKCPQCQTTIPGFWT